MSEREPNSLAFNDVMKFKIDDEAIKNFQDLLWTKTFKAGDITKITSLYSNVINGQGVGWIGSFEDAGTNQEICNPTYHATKLNTAKDVWKLGDITFAETLCASDTVKTIMKYTMQKGTKIGDLTNTDFMSKIIIPRYLEMIEDAYWRVAFLGDTGAKSVTDGGKVTDGYDLDLINMSDGFFKRIEDIITTNPSQLIEIKANNASTFKEQREALKVKGVATGIFDDLIYNADIRLREDPNRFILCTSSMSDALAIDLKQSNIGSDLQWKSLFGGLAFATEYNGEKIIRVPQFDKMIQKIENKGEAINAPHRAIYCSQDSLMLGFETNGMVTDLEMNFQPKERVNYMYARNAMGTLIGEPELVYMAY